jgi:hypothetical protein
MTSTQRLTGRIQVALPPNEAFRLFTPRGEQDWAHGWRPHFPAPAATGTGGPLAVPAAEVGDWRYWPRSLMNYLPSAARAAGGSPSLVIGHFQLPVA